MHRLLLHLKHFHGSHPATFPFDSNTAVLCGNVNFTLFFKLVQKEHIAVAVSKDDLFLTI